MTISAADLTGSRVRLLRRIRTRYAHAPLRVRVRLLLRAVNCPLDRIAALVPSSATVLDLGCGCGFATVLLASRGNGLIVGMDHDGFSLGQAVRAAPSVRFVRGSALELPFRRLGAILVSDVLYLLPAEGQVAALAECRTALAAGGTLILKTTDLTPRWKHWWNIIQETTVVRVLGLTKGAGGFSFPGRRGFETLLASAGFHVDRCVPLGRGYLHAHIAIVARRNA